MLSKKAYQDRFWQGYPELRHILEGKETSMHKGLAALLSSATAMDGPLPSTSQHSMDRLADVLCITRLLAKYQGDVQGAMAADSSPERIAKEVRQLLEELEDRLHVFLSSFERDIEAARTVAEDVQRYVCKLRSFQSAKRGGV